MSYQQPFDPQQLANSMSTTIAKKLISRILETEANCDEPLDVELRLEAIIGERDHLRGRTALDADLIKQYQAQVSQLERAMEVQRKAAIFGMDAAKEASSHDLELARRLMADSSPAAGCKDLATENKSAEPAATNEPRRCVCGRSKNFHPWLFCDSYQPVALAQPAETPAEPTLPNGRYWPSPYVHFVCWNCAHTYAEHIKTDDAVLCQSPTKEPGL